jgi:hypothetical protein
MFADVWSSQISIPSVTITINVWISFRGEGKTICYFCLSFEILRRRIKWCLHRRIRTRLVYEQSRRNSPSAGWCVCLCVCVCQALTFLSSKTAHNTSCDCVDIHYVSLGNFISILHVTWIFLIQCSCAFVSFKCSFDICFCRWNSSRRVPSSQMSSANLSRARLSAPCASERACLCFQASARW